MATQIRTDKRLYVVQESVSMVQQALNRVLGEGQGGPFIKFKSAKDGTELLVKAAEVEDIQGLPESPDPPSNPRLKGFLQR